ncbi:hypothetical protein E4U51_007218 [Claviceps purpurea]|nr:hypothetical protein E4U51_007218 [Claviceps purpurea]
MTVCSKPKCFDTFVKKLKQVPRGLEAPDTVNARLRVQLLNALKDVDFLDVVARNPAEEFRDIVAGVSSRLEPLKDRQNHPSQLITITDSDFESKTDGTMGWR